jgi:hypothetical protein
MKLIPSALAALLSGRNLAQARRKKPPAVGI